MKEELKNKAPLRSLIELGILLLAAKIDVHVNNVKGKHRNKRSYANKRTTGKEQYYTNAQAVELCLEELSKFVDLKDRTIIEPCGGTGEFIEGLKRHGVPEGGILSYDIEPKHSAVTKGDYLKQDLSGIDNAVVITNPPYGRASSLAKKFFNHSAPSSEYICFLVPKAWRKWSTHNSLDSSFRLVADIDMPQNCFYLPDGKEAKKGVLQTVFQIWKRSETPRPKIKIPDHGLIKKIIPKDDGNGNKVIEGANFSIIAFGHSCGRCEDVTEDVVPYKTTTMYLSVEDEAVKSAMKEMDLSCYYNNVSYVQALSIQEINYELNKIFNLPNFVF